MLTMVEMLVPVGLAIPLGSALALMHPSLVARLRQWTKRATTSR